MNFAAVHILKKELALTDADYRTLLRRIAGVGSAKELDEDSYRAVLREMYRLRDERRNAAKARPKTPQESKIWALWYELKEYLPRPERTLSYLLGIIRRVTGNADVTAADDIGALDRRDAHDVIEALKLRLAQEEAQLQQEVPF